ncbi:MAG: hypothetical protein MJK18_04855, partial [Bdellovibrionales bacterium]|nr:hypothetical protein [Bdellovibrionales bacterium]
MKIALIGHRGVGKSGLLNRLKNYLSHVKDLEFLSLDQEIEKSQGKSITEIFSESGEIIFRKLELETFQKIYKAQKNFIIDIGAGYEGDFPEDLEVIWIQRPVDSSQSLFLDRPSLDGRLRMDLQRYLRRNQRYSELATQELELLQHVNDHCEYEKKFFESLIDHENPASPSSWLLTLMTRKENIGLLNTLTGCGFELRDDLLDQDTVKRFLGQPFKKVISLRNNETRDQTLSLMDDQSL